MKETRNLTTKIELRENPDARPTIHGYAAVYDSLSEPLYGMFYERIAPGAFGKALARNPDVRALIDHESTRVLGRS